MKNFLKVGDEKQEKISSLKERIISALKRSTFHGIDIIMEAPKGWKRLTMILFVAIMSVFATAGSIYSLIGFLNFPYKTLVNFEQESFHFPEVTICPFSPFTEDMLKNAPKDAQQKFDSLLNFWNASKPLEGASAMEHLKRSFTPLYYQHNEYLKNEWNKLFLSCYYNGRSCLNKIVEVEHPMAMQCFQVSMNLSELSGTRSGYARGLQMILFRNDESTPMLMLNEFYDQMYMEFINGKNMIKKFDGVLIVIHSKDEIPSHKLTASSNNYPIVYGNRVSITLKEKYYKQTRTSKRLCSKKQVYYKLLKLSDYFRSRTIENQKKSLSLNLGNCASIFRQKLISYKCNCFTENEMIPSDLVQDFIAKGFCHDVLWSRQKSREKILEQIRCSQEINLIPDKRILAIFRQKRKANNLSDGKAICTIPCDRNILSLKRVQTIKLVSPINLTLFPDYFKSIAQQNLRSPFEVERINQTAIPSENQIIIDIHAEEERIPILDEDLDKNFSNFIAEIGGVFGLFLGFSGVTAFEVIECVILLLTIVFILFSGKSGRRNENFKIKDLKKKKTKKVET